MHYDTTKKNEIEETLTKQWTYIMIIYVWLYASLLRKLGSNQELNNPKQILVPLES